MANGKAKFVKKFVFDDDSSEKLSLQELAFQYLREAAMLLISDDAALSYRGRERLKAVAELIGKTADGALWSATVNKTNAKKPRPNAAADVDDEIILEFRRLRRENFSPREARGKMNNWGRWSQSTIYRKTKEEK